MKFGMSVPLNRKGCLTVTVASASMPVVVVFQPGLLLTGPPSNYYKVNHTIMNWLRTADITSGVDFVPDADHNYLRKGMAIRILSLSNPPASTTRPGSSPNWTYSWTMLNHGIILTPGYQNFPKCLTHNAVSNMNNNKHIKIDHVLLRL